MATVIKKTADHHGIFRYIEGIDVNNYPVIDWEHNPDISNVPGENKQYWKYNGTSTVELMSAEEQDAIKAGLLDYENPVMAGTLYFEKNGWCRNKWIGFGPSKSSNSTPFIIPCPMNVTGITFINSIDAADTDIEIHQNGTKVFTWEIRNKRWSWKTQGVAAITFKPGDKIGIYLADSGKNPRDVIVTLHYASDLQEVGENGSATL